MDFWESIPGASKLWNERLSIVASIILIFVKDSLAVRCYECNPSTPFSIGGAFSSGSGSSGTYSSSSSSSSSDCYTADSRQLKDCPWDTQSCYTVVMPGPTSGGLSPTSSSTSSLTSSAQSQQAQVVSRGCGRAPQVKPTDVAENECKVVVLTPASSSLTLTSSTSTIRATVCQCKSESCNDKRPDQIVGSGMSSSTNALYSSMSGSSNWLGPYGSGTPFPGGPYRDYSLTGGFGNGNPYGAYGQQGYYPQGQNGIAGGPNTNFGVTGRSSPSYGPSTGFNSGSNFYPPSGFQSGFPPYQGSTAYPSGFSVSNVGGVPSGFGNGNSNTFGGGNGNNNGFGGSANGFGSGANGFGNGVNGINGGTNGFVFNPMSGRYEPNGGSGNGNGNGGFQLSPAYGPVQNGNGALDPNAARGSTSQRDKPSNPWASPGTNGNDPGTEFIVTSERELKAPYNGVSGTAVGLISLVLVVIVSWVL